MKSIVAIAAIAFCSVAFAGQDEVLKNSQSSVSASASVSKQMQMAQSMGGSTTSRSHSDSESSASPAADTIITKSSCKTVRKNNVRQELCVTQTRHVSPQEAEGYLRQLEK